MRNPGLQVTLRGLPPQTKAALEKQAAEEGTSFNKYAIESLNHTAGTETSEERYRRMKAFISKHRIPHDEIQRIEEAIAWGDKASLEKQKRDERELGL